MIDADRRWMRRALRLASLASGTTWPNPGVGCVLVRDGTVLGEGRTAARNGQDAVQEHAEAAAVRHARAAGHDLTGCTAYVTLAPCATRSRGGTPCCAVLIGAGVARVVIASEDPSQSASVQRLREAGLAVTCGVEAAAAAHVHGGFLTRIRDKRPRFTAKWAMTLDGCLATHRNHSGWISSDEALVLSRRRRRAFDAILIGGGTARSDDPALLCSRPRLAGPLRIVVGSADDLPDDRRLLHSIDAAPLLLVHRPVETTAMERLRGWGVQFQALEDTHDLVALARALGAWGMNDVLVEGGAAIHGAFLRAGLYDRLELYQGAISIGGGLPVARGLGVGDMSDGLRWQPEEPPRLLGTTVLSRWRRQ